MSENSIQEWSELELLGVVQDILSRPGDLTKEDKLSLLVINREFRRREEERENNEASISNCSK